MKSKSVMRLNPQISCRLLSSAKSYFVTAVASAHDPTAHDPTALCHSFLLPISMHRKPAIPSEIVGHLLCWRQLVCVLCECQALQHCCTNLIQLQIVSLCQLQCSPSFSDGERSGANITLMNKLDLCEVPSEYSIVALNVRVILAFFSLLELQRE